MDVCKEYITCTLLILLYTLPYTHAFTIRSPSCLMDAIDNRALTALYRP